VPFSQEFGNPAVLAFDGHDKLFLTANALNDPDNQITQPRKTKALQMTSSGTTKDIDWVVLKKTDVAMWMLSAGRCKVKSEIPVRIVAREVHFSADTNRTSTITGHRAYLTNPLDTTHPHRRHPKKTFQARSSHCRRGHTLLRKTTPCPLQQQKSRSLHPGSDCPHKG
jgi:hypothetical protein